MTNDIPICEKHHIKKILRECQSCRGTGEIDTDDPINFPRGFERCWQCNGSGNGFWECEFCEMEVMEDLT